MKGVLRSAASLLSAFLGLAGALVRLATVLVLWATGEVEGRSSKATGRPSTVRRAALRVVERTPEGERLVSTLVRLGFETKAVRAFVNELGTRVGQEPTERLIREGLAKLAA